MGFSGQACVIGAAVKLAKRSLAVERERERERERKRESALRVERVCHLAPSKWRGLKRRRQKRKKKMKKKKRKKR